MKISGKEMVVSSTSMEAQPIQARFELAVQLRDPVGWELRESGGRLVLRQANCCNGQRG